METPLASFDLGQPEPLYNQPFRAWLRGALFRRRETGVVIVWPKWFHVCLMDLELAQEQCPALSPRQMFLAEGAPLFPESPLAWGWGREWGKGRPLPPHSPRASPHLDGWEHEAHDEVGEPVHSPVHQEGGRPRGLQEDLCPHHGGDRTSGQRAQESGLERGTEGSGPKPTPPSEHNLLQMPRKEAHISQPAAFIPRAAPRCTHSLAPS